MGPHEPATPPLPLAPTAGGPVLIVGAGCAGLVAALAAARRGARVELFDAVDPTTAPENEESNTARSSGLVPAAGTRLQREAGILDDSPEIMANDVRAANGGQCDSELVAHVCSVAASAVDWLCFECGLELICFTDFLYHGHSKYRMHGPKEGYGRALVHQLARRVAEEPLICCRYQIRIVDVLKDSRGQVSGLRCEDGQGGTGFFDVVGCAVILATCGFGGNQDMVSKYIDNSSGARMSGAHYQGSPHNTGVGIRWGEALGGELRHMGAFQGHATVTVSPTPMLVTYGVIVNGGILINSQGRRFGNENVGYSEFSAAVLAQGEGVLELFGERTYAACRGTRLEQVVQAGLVSEHPSLEAVAAAHHLPIDALRRTVLEVNRAVESGRADEHGRVWAAHGAAQLQPPFYTVRVQGALFHTQGGLRVDHDARVISAVTGKPVPRLFAAGGAAAGVSGDTVEGYLSGNGLLTATVFGKAAGDAAAAVYHRQSSASKL